MACSQYTGLRRGRLEFEDLANLIEPLPETQLWRKAIDRCTRQALYYQLDLRSPIPRIKRAVRISCNNKSSDGGVATLIPTVFIGERVLGLRCVESAIGKREIATWYDLAALLDEVCLHPEPIWFIDSCAIFGRLQPDRCRFLIIMRTNSCLLM